MNRITTHPGDVLKEELEARGHFAEEIEALMREHWGFLLRGFVTLYGMRGKNC